MDLLAELRDRKMLAIIRADGPDTALACVRTLVDAGITALEISLTTPGAVDAIAKARAEYDPSILIGAGTVITAAQADDVAAARAGFVVTPAITRGAHRSVELGLPLRPRLLPRTPRSPARRPAHRGRRSRRRKRP